MRQHPIADAPPSAKLVYKVLEYNGAMTQKEIVGRSMLSPRTVRVALGRLEAMDVVSEEVYIPDARQNLYRLIADVPSDGSKSGSKSKAAANHSD